MQQVLTNDHKNSPRSDDSNNTLDNLDLLNLPFSITENVKNRQDCGSGDAHTTLNERKIPCKDLKRNTNPYGDCNVTLVTDKVQADNSSLVCLYKNDHNFGNLNRTASDDFLIPLYKKRKSSSIAHIDEPRTKSNLIEEKSKRATKFPFRVTPSGNLKVESKQVAFENENVSVLVANPEITTVKIRNPDSVEMVNPSDETEDRSSAMDALMSQNLNNTLQSFLSGRMKMPHRKREESEEYQGRATADLLEPELNLDRLGFSQEEHISWDKVQLPEKKNMYLELYNRITNFVNADCKVYIDTEEFNCHLLVLQCYSEVFDTYVAVKKVELPADKCSPAAFAFIYEWMITGDPSYHQLSRSNVLDIFNSAKYLKIKDLVEQCWAFIDNPEIFSEETAFLLYLDAKHKDLPEVRELMLPRIQKFFLMLVSSQDWVELEFNDVKAFLKSNYICVNGEMEIFMAAVRWLCYDPANRRCKSHELLSCIRFGNIAPWQLVDIKRNPDNPEFLELINDPDICKLIDDGLAYVIIKYWYGHENEDFVHWNSILALQQPTARNWSGTEKIYFNYREFLIYLDQYRRQHMLERSKLPRGDERPARPFAPPSRPCSPHISAHDVMPPPPTSHQHHSQNCGGAGGGGAAGGVSGRSVPIKVPTADEFLATRRAGEVVNINIRKEALNSKCHDVPIGLIRSGRKRNRLFGQNEAATIIQAVYRGYRARQELAQSRRKKFTKTRNLRSSLPAGQLPWNKTTPRQLDPATVMSVRTKDTKPAKILSMFEQPKPKRADQGPVAAQRRNKANTLFAVKKKDLVSESSLFYHEHECVLICGGIDQHSTYGNGRNTAKDIYKYVPHSNSWDFVGELPQPRCYHSMAFVTGRVYVAGGLDPSEDKIKDLVWSFEPVSRNWYSEGSLNEGRSCFGLVSINKMLFAIGGKDSHSRVTGSVERYDPAIGSWEYVSPLRHPRMGLACAKYEDCIWVVGGMSGSRKKPLTDSVECYDVDTNQWTEIVKLRRPRSFASLFNMANKLYLIGGAGKSADHSGVTCSFSSVEVWNRNLKKWEDHTDMEVARHGATVAYLGTQILIIGGVTTQYMRSLTNIECFCTTRNTWIRGMACLPLPLSGHATVTLPPAILL